MPTKERKRKELRKIEVSGGQGKISFTTLPRLVCKPHKIIFDIDSGC